MYEDVYDDEYVDWDEVSAAADQVEAKLSRTRQPKRKRETLDLSDDEEEPPKKWGPSQVYHFCWRWSWSPKLGITVDDFVSSEMAERLCEALRAEGGKEARFVFQLEKTGDTNLHFQGYCHTTTKMRALTLGGRLGTEFPGIEVQESSTAGREALRKYCMKADTRVKGPWADRAIEAPYDGSDLPKKWRPWQQAVIDAVSVPCKDDRTVNWIYDPEGGIGKSKLTKWLSWKEKAMPMALSDVKDGAYQIVEAGARGAYFFDIPRTKSRKVSMDELYSLVESVKNGLVVSHKYKGGILRMLPPHVWVVSNWEPDVTKMSAGRIKVWAVTPLMILQRHVPTSDSSTSTRADRLRELVS